MHTQVRTGDLDPDRISTAHRRRKGLSAKIPQPALIINEMKTHYSSRMGLLVACSLLLAVATAVADEKPDPLPPEPNEGQLCNSYVNRRFGYKIKFPADLIAGRHPENGAGRSFSTPDKEFVVYTQAHFIQDERNSLDDYWNSEIEALKKTITYKKKGKSWYVISGVDVEGHEFYKKFSVKGGNCAEFTIEYPHAKNKKYDPWVEKIVKSFVPFVVGKDFDRK